MFCRFSVCAGYYLYATRYHGGQGTKEYAYLGRLAKIGYKPSPAIQNGQLDYHAALVFSGLIRAGLPAQDASGYRTCLCRDCGHATLDAFCSDCELAECGTEQDCCSDQADYDACIDDSGQFHCPDCGGVGACHESCPSRL